VTRLPNLGSRGEGWVILQIVLLLAVGAAGLVGPAWSGAALEILALVGLMLIVAGLILVARGTRDLRQAMTPLPHPRDDAQLVETGIYAHVRHPIYGGVILGAFGWGLLTASVLALVLATVTAGFFLLKSTREEEWLMETYPGYADYRRRTRRLIPWIG
jgi:protein-S-isoprenylcysteine O-methyltransferase Ste14